jgi:hypothetical protein
MRTKPRDDFEQILLVETVVYIFDRPTSFESDETESWEVFERKAGLVVAVLILLKFSICRKDGMKQAIVAAHVP